MKTPKTSKYNYYFQFLMFLSLLIFTMLFNNNNFCYDEPYYYNNVVLLNKFGLTNQFLRSMHSHAGPLHGVILWILQIITHGNVQLVRMVNLILLFAIIQFAKLIYNKINTNHPIKNSLELGIMSIPMIYVCSGLALTEIPALFFLTFSMYLLQISNLEKIDYRWIIAGIFMSFAILGRQPYLLIAPIFIIYFYLTSKSEIKFLNTCLFALFTLALPIYVFYVWKGLVPPFITKNFTSKENFNILYIILGLGYSFLLALLIDRKFILPLNKFKYFLLFLLILTFAICYSLHFNYFILKSLIDKFIPLSYSDFLGAINSSILIILGVWYLASLLFQIYLNRYDNNKLILLIPILFIIISCGKITHQFSSRYIFQAGIFFVLIQSSNKKDNIQILLRVVGGLIGFISLLSYIF